MNSHDFRIDTDGCELFENPSKIFTALGILSCQLEKLDKIMMGQLSDRNLSLNYRCPAGLSGGTEIVINSNLNYPEDVLDEIKVYLLSSRRVILESINNIKSRDDFNILCSDLIDLEKQITKKTTSLILPICKLPVEKLAEAIVSLSEITLSRRTNTKIIYIDNNGKIYFQCGRKISHEEILGTLKEDDTEYYGEFDIKKAPGDINVQFTLMRDSKQIKHEMCSDIFLKEWINGEHDFKCFAKMCAKYKAVKTHHGVLFRITEVLEIKLPEEPKKQLDLIC
ncbi:hypothetical protein [Desulfuromonas thiophila]|uniref:Uncharacterized protein n=1 Tax=Desulfuromonas thiophila TaxID=57664 RepID=A0A1G7DW46_9BACT|nr:hypothetical protein [Desulfuromonas thiophila]SDE55698.1 hypothetical protein SAMN05661003_1166 [Desulfuromonas thiophila]